MSEIEDLKARIAVLEGEKVSQGIALRNLNRREKKKPVMCELNTKHTYQVEMKMGDSDDYEPAFEWFWTKEEAMEFIAEEFKTKRVLGGGDDQSEEYYTHAELYTNLSHDAPYDHPADSVVDDVNNPEPTEVIRRS